GRRSAVSSTRVGADCDFGLCRRAWNSVYLGATANAPIIGCALGAVQGANIRLRATVTRWDSAVESGSAPIRAEHLRPESAVWKGGVCDASARCGLSEPCPDHILPEEHHPCATARTPATTTESPAAVRAARSAASSATTRPRTKSATGT